MKCKYCNNEIDEGSVFCGYCGKKQPEVKYCIKCGQEISPDDVFCGFCGASQKSQLSPNHVEENENKVNCSSKPESQSTSIPTKGKSTINIHGYTQWFAITPDVKIIVNGQVMGKVGKDEIFQIHLSAPCQLKFECSFSSTTINIDPSTDSDVYLSFDRISGSLIANKYNDTSSIDKPSIGLDIVSFLIPIVGLVLYFVKKEKSPQSAKSYLICAICGFALGLVISFL